MRGGRAARTLAVALAGVCLGATVAACGGDPYASYCDEVDDQRTAISDAVEQGAAVGLLTALPSFEALADRAPSDIADDWSVVVDRLTALDRALSEADVDPATYDPQDPPAGLSADQERRIRGAATQLLNPVTGRALDAVEQQARDVCGAPLLS